MFDPRFVVRPALQPLCSGILAYPLTLLLVGTGNDSRPPHCIYFRRLVLYRTSSLSVLLSGRNDLRRMKNGT